MKKFIASSMVLSLALVMLMTVIGNAAAGGFSVVGEPYEDTKTRGYSRDSSKVRRTMYIDNGDFSFWTAGLPDAWTLAPPVLAPNWEVRVGRADYARGPEDLKGISNALTVFVRAGSEGEQYVYLSQPVNSALRSGDYWVQLHMSAWQDRVTSAYNSVAWYGFGSSADPASVTEWRELFPAEFACHESTKICPFYGRRELTHIDAGSHMHLKLGMKFPDHQAWTMFWLDNIAVMAPLDKETTVEIDDFYDTEAVVRWKRHVIR